MVDSVYIVRTSGTNDLGRVRDCRQDSGGIWYFECNNVMPGGYAMVVGQEVVGWFTKAGWLKDNRIALYNPTNRKFELAVE